MINKIKDIPDGTEVWVKMRREKCKYDNDNYIRFVVVGKNGDHACIDDESEVLTEEQMRERFSVNDNIPKQGDDITIDGYLGDRWSKVNFKGILKILPEKGDLINGNEVAYSEINIFTRSKSGCISLTKSYRYPPKKIQKTLAELEKELGYDEGTLEITN